MAILMPIGGLSASCAVFILRGYFSDGSPLNNISVVLRNVSESMRSGTAHMFARIVGKQNEKHCSTIGYEPDASDCLRRPVFRSRFGGRSKDFSGDRARNGDLTVMAFESIGSNLPRGVVRRNRERLCMNESRVRSGIRSRAKRWSA